MRGPHTQLLFLLGNSIQAWDTSNPHNIGEGQGVQQDRPQVGILVDTGQTRRRSQNSIQDAVGTLRIFGNALWVDQTPPHNS